MKKYLTVYKLFFGLLGFSAIVTEIATLMNENVFKPENFFSFFTIESNILAVISFIASAFFVYAGQKTKRFDYFRGAVTFYMLVTGVVFAVFLSGIEGIRLTAVPWDNVVLHYLIPIAIAIDWIINPPTKHIGFKRASLWIVFPVAYLIYSLIRGAVVNWYPYPFLNPANGGYGAVAVTAVIIMIVGLGIIFTVTKVSVHLAKKR